MDDVKVEVGVDGDEYYVGGDLLVYTPSLQAQQTLSRYTSRSCRCRCSLKYSNVKSCETVEMRSWLLIFGHLIMTYRDSNRNVQAGRPVISITSDGNEE